MSNGGVILAVVFFFGLSSLSMNEYFCMTASPQDEEDPITEGSVDETISTDGHRVSGKGAEEPLESPRTISEGPGSRLGPYELLETDWRRQFWRGVHG